MRVGIIGKIYTKPMNEYDRLKLDLALIVLKEFPPKYAWRAVRAILKTDRDEKYLELSMKNWNSFGTKRKSVLISLSFTWSFSVEGENFWADVIDDLDEIDKARAELEYQHQH